MKIVEKSFNISGMTCNSCEKTITRVLRNSTGVTYVKVSYQDAFALVKYDEDLVKFEDLVSAIEKEGYGVNKKSDKGDLIYMALLLIGGYLLIKNTIGFDFIPEVDQTMGFGILLVVGFLTSFHCMAMCGGINLSQCMSFEEDDKKSTILPSLLYNSGRVVSYTIIGVIVGGIGGVISFSEGLTKSINIFAGLFMILMGLKMLNIFPALRNFNIGIPKKFRRAVNKQKRNKSPFVVGLLNGLMPCGPLQSMQLYALGTGSMFEGGLSMFFFSLGTVPLMFGFGTLGSYISGKFKHQVTMFSALLVIVLGLVMANRGLGISFSGASGTKAVEKDGIQYVETEFTNGKYQPITVEKGTPVEWIIYIDEKDLTGCNNKILISEYGIKRDLYEGKNVIKFTPDETGTFKYTCWMRMLRSSITVVDKL
ncbi:MAG: heavy metal transporter [Haloplasmataceae bacterium]|nr:heavy metal transporter [Haloplasmataceae bacterium]